MHEEKAVMPRKTTSFETLKRHKMLKDLFYFSSISSILFLFTYYRVTKKVIAIWEKH